MAILIVMANSVSSAPGDTSQWKGTRPGCIQPPGAGVAYVPIPECTGVGDSLPTLGPALMSQWPRGRPHSESIGGHVGIPSDESWEKDPRQCLRIEDEPNLP